MREYLHLGHMELIPPDELDQADVYYIPLHAVFHNNKIRVVFNASMPVFNGLSLNVTLYTGPKLQQDIVLVSIKWRTFKVRVPIREWSYRNGLCVHRADLSISRPPLTAAANSKNLL